MDDLFNPLARCERQLQEQIGVIHRFLLHLYAKKPPFATTTDRRLNAPLSIFSFFNAKHGLQHDFGGSDFVRVNLRVQQYIMFAPSRAVQPTHGGLGVSCWAATSVWEMCGSLTGL